MKKIMIIFAIGTLVACGSTEENEDPTKIEVKEETAEKVKKAQDANVELEEIDGELDSLINAIK